MQDLRPVVRGRDRASAQAASEITSITAALSGTATGRIQQFELTRERDAAVAVHVVLSCQVGLGSVIIGTLQASGLQSFNTKKLRCLQGCVAEAIYVADLR